MQNNEQNTALVDLSHSTSYSKQLPWLRHRHFDPISLLSMTTLSKTKSNNEMPKLSITNIKTCSCHSDKVEDSEMLRGHNKLKYNTANGHQQWCSQDPRNRGKAPLMMHANFAQSDREFLGVNWGLGKPQLLKKITWFKSSILHKISDKTMLQHYRRNKLQLHTSTLNINNGAI